MSLTREQEMKEAMEKIAENNEKGSTLHSMFFQMDPTVPMTCASGSAWN